MIAPKQWRPATCASALSCAMAVLAATACGGKSERAAIHDSPDDAGDEASQGSCVLGSPCTPGGNPCLLGTTSCTAGIAKCVGAGEVPAGTGCGTNQVCNSGACVACAGGAPCSPGDNVCQTGVTSCAAGSPSCSQISNVANGTPCGTGEVCFDGSCTACAGGASCDPDGNVCQTGTTSCSTGETTCVRTGEAADGTSCATNEFCVGGFCTSCTAGTPCTGVCQTGVLSCQGGQASCVPTATAPDGTPCGTNDVCLSGACDPCTPGIACVPEGNPCETGAISCSTGTATCVATGNGADETSCGTGSICCEGTCATCSASSHATDTCSGTTCTASCASGFSMCGGQCVNITNDDGACGPSCRVCPGGSHCVEQQCTAQYGDDTAFSPCATGSIAVFSPGYLLGETVAVQSTITLSGLGVIGNPGGTTAILALYTDSGGAPAELVARTAVAPIGAGPNLIPVEPPTPMLAPGTYWILAEYSGMATLCVDSATTNPTAYEAVPFGTVPASLQSTTTYPAEDINYYLVGTE